MVAAALCYRLHTPLPEILALPLVEALAWAETVGELHKRNVEEE